MTRRDKCYYIGKRTRPAQPGAGRQSLALPRPRPRRHGRLDVPRFKHLPRAIRAATISEPQVSH